MFNPPLLVEARAIELKRDLVQPEKTEMILGNFMPVLADGVKDLQKISQKVRDRAGVWDRGNQFNVDGSLNTSWLNGTIDVLANGLNSAVSNWHTDENGNIIFLSADGLKAMKLTGEGFAISNQKDVNGAWIWRTFGTGSGFTADELNAGTIRTNIVKVHGDGSYTELSPNGLKRYVAGTGKEYHYLMYVGSGIIYKNYSNPTQEPPILTVTLPDEFKGKNFQISTSIVETGYPSGNKRFDKVRLYVVSKNIANGTFNIEGYTRHYDGTTYEYDTVVFAYTAIA
jgi:hypothetical protein